MEEAEALPEDEKPIRLRPKRLSKPKYGLVLRREKTMSGWALHLTGSLACDMLTDRVFDEVERLRRGCFLRSRRPEGAHCRPSGLPG